MSESAAGSLAVSETNIKEWLGNVNWKKQRARSWDESRMGETETEHAIQLVEHNVAC